MTIIEVGAGHIYASTDSKDELLALIAFLQENIYRMEARHQRAVTIYEAFEIEPPRRANQDNGESGK